MSEGVREFPPGFLWGAGTSAYQVEGGIHLDDRGPSIWDTFSHTPGRVRDGDNGDEAADHRRRMEADVDLLAELGIPAYRFSVAWPRVQPDGRGPASRSGLDFYRALVDRLLERGIEPVLTLYHWDLPQALEDRGGWPHRDTAYRFTDYTELVGEALGDRVRHWTTINEPWCAAMLGYASGSHAPGRTEPAAALRAAHHLLLAHGLGMDVLRGTVRKDAELGITVNLYPVSTDGRREADGEAVRRIDGLMNRSYLDPVLLGHYPADVLADLEEVTDFAHVRDGDLPRIAQPIDALGVNYYRPHRVRYARTLSASPSPWPGSPDVAFDPPVRTPPTANGWAVEPDGLREVLVRLVREYPRVPLYIHECGAAFEDRMGPDGHIHDRERIAFVDAHLRAAHDGLKAGADLRGYFVWSLLDNFEWAEGYTYRFGLVHVDFATQRRTPKASARWFKGVAAANALDAEPAW